MRTRTPVAHLVGAGWLAGVLVLHAVTADHAGLGAALMLALTAACLAALRWQALRDWRGDERRGLAPPGPKKEPPS